MTEAPQEQAVPQWLRRLFQSRRGWAIAAIILAIAGVVTAVYAHSSGWGVLGSEIAFALAVLSAGAAVLTTSLRMTADGQQPAGDTGQLSEQRSVERYPRKIIKLVSVLFSFGMAALVLYAIGQNAPTKLARLLLFAVLALEAFAAFASGALAGFLFGIPRRLRTPVPQAQPQTEDRQSNSQQNGKPDSSAAAATASWQVEQTRLREGYDANTSLEEISDWLTKIIVGLGLIELKIIPTKLRNLAAYFSSLSSCSQGCIPVPESVSLSTLIYFFVCGFFFAYLLTRLLLPRAFSLAEREALGALQTRQERMAGELNEAATVALTNEARVLINGRPGEEELNKALEWIAKALNFSPRYYVAYIEKGRALKRLSQLKHDQQLLREALEAVNKAQQLAPRPYYAAFYNAACYKALLGRPAEEVAADLKQGLELYPPLKELAAKDDDLASVRGNEQIEKLLSS